MIYKTILKRMQWQDNKNYMDCGVIHIRHMETYKGKKKTMDGWDALLKETNENLKIFALLRAKYMHMIIIFEINSATESVQLAASKHYNKDN